MACATADEAAPQRRSAAKDMELTLRIGEGRPGDDETWIYELDDIRVIVVEDGLIAHIVTVIRLRSRT